MLELDLHEKFEMEALDIMRRQKVLEKLIFCGGTMLRLCFGLNRYSVDLDFHLKTGKEYKKEFKLLKEGFIKEGFEITDHQEKYFTYLMEIRGRSYPRRLKIEIRKQPPDDTLIMQNIAFSKIAPTLQVKLATYTLEQMWKDKIRAFLERKEIRDIFDIEFLLRRGAGNMNNLDKETLTGIMKGLEDFNEFDFRNKLGNLLPAKERKFYSENKFAFLKGALMELL
jgi:predicted nucleotidyltransferase component of viral defense system